MQKKIDSKLLILLYEIVVEYLTLWSNDTAEDVIVHRTNLAGYTTQHHTDETLNRLASLIVLCGPKPPTR